MKGETKVKKSVSITLDEELLKESKKKAEEESRSYSGYINNLIRKDLEVKKQAKKKSKNGLEAILLFWN